MRILVVGPYGDGRRSGYEDAVPAIATGLRAHAHVDRVDVGAPWRIGEAWSRWRLLGHAPRSLGFATLHPRRTAATMVHAAANAVRARAALDGVGGRAGPPDAVHVHGLNPHTFPFVRAARRRGIATFVSLHALGRFSDPVSRPWNRWTEGRLFGWCARHEVPLSFVSEGLRRAAADAYGAHGTVIRNGVDVERFQAPVPDGPWNSIDGPIILQSGSLVERKAPLLTLQAFARLPGRLGAQLVFMGDGPLRSALAAQAARLGLERVHLLGRVSDREVAPWFQRAAVLCLPSEHEGMPLVLLQAMAAGLPVVAGAQLEGVTELQGDLSGVFPQRRDPGAFASALQQALETTWDRAAMRNRAVDWSWPAACAHYARWLRGSAATNAEATP